MANELTVVSVNDIERMANAVAKSNLFGVKTPEQAMALMLIAQAEGLHPAIAARDYHIINNKPSLKADAMLARFHTAGGTVKWNDYTDTKCSATISHPQGGSVTVEWTIEMAKKIGLTKNKTWADYPRQMLRARVISEGIRTVYPGVAVGVYTPEEVQDFDDKPMKDVTPANDAIPEVVNAKSIFKNAAARNKFCLDMKTAFEGAPTVEALATAMKENITKIEEMKASGNEHDGLGVDSIRTHYALAMQRLKDSPEPEEVNDRMSDADISKIKGYPDEPEYHTDDPLPPEVVEIPSFFRRAQV